jgi:hypothetical protein
MATVPSLLLRLASDDVLDAAFQWLRKARRDYPDSADIWDFRRDWDWEKTAIKRELLNGKYQFGLLDRIVKADGSEIDLWRSRDALVLKALSIVLASVLPISSRCTHVKGNGGAKSAVRQVQASLSQNRFVLRTDVKSYYASINHVLLLDRLAEFIRERPILNLCGQYMKRTSEQAGWFFDHHRGISLGCPLSPLMGAFFLHDLDTRMEETSLFYVRFMDDILVLAPTHSKLRTAVRAVNEVLSRLMLEKHPDKTFIGRIERGFDFLGYRFGEAVLTLAKATIQNFVDHATRLYEQGRRERQKAPLLGGYMRRWSRWARAGLGKNFLALAVPENLPANVSACPNSVLRWNHNTARAVAR